MKPLFSGISEIYRAFFLIKPLSDPEVGKAAERVIQLLEENGDSLGFAKKRERKNLPSVVSNILAEEDINLSDRKVEELVLYLKEKKESDLARKRFFVQSIITFLIIFLCFYLLTFGKADQDTQKAIFGLLGTVLGYWLR
jgi:hypothetical protein